MLKIHSRAPTRIDLAGGTIDLWPLFLFMKNPLTINVGIDLFAEAFLTETPASDAESRKVRLKSRDQDAVLEFDWKDVENVTPPPTVELHFKLLKRVLSGLQAQGTPLKNWGTLTLETQALSPAGAGLGGSSTLSVALVGAIQAWADKPLSVGKEGAYFVEVVRDVETTVIQVPAGMQDYYGAMYGGLQKIEWGAPRHRTSQLTKQGADLDGLERRITLFYSGKSRNSGINNWALYKQFIDKDPAVREKFAQILQATHDLEGALIKKNWTAVGHAIASEWQARRTLAEGISTPEIDAAFAVAAGMDIRSGKICGAGGGGCFFFYHDNPHPTVRAKLIEKITALGVRHLPIHLVPKGLDVTQEE